MKIKRKNDPIRKNEIILRKNEKRKAISEKIHIKRKNLVSRTKD